MQNHLFKVIGSMLIITGTCIGAGMLALPIATAGCGFAMTIALLVFVWALMLTTALYILEANLAFAPGTSFGNMAKETLGLPGQIISWLSVLLLLYSLTAAYTTAGASLLITSMELALNVKLPQYTSILLFTLVLGTFVYWSTRAVDQLNRVLMGLKTVTFILLITFLSPHIEIKNLASELYQIKYIWLTFPLLITAFGYHTVIPSIRLYLGDDVKKLRSIIIWGSTIPLFIYLFWEMVVLGVIPLNGALSFKNILDHGGNVGALITETQHIIQSQYPVWAMNAFTDIAVTTSFLGVTLGLFDFIADGFKINRKKHKGRMVTAFLTYCPPIIFAITYPNGFITALSYASIFVSILLIILPAMMVIKIRKSETLNTRYQTYGGKLLLNSVIFAGIAIIGLHFANEFSWLPSFH